MHGPQHFQWLPESPARFRFRSRRVPAPALRPTLEDWADPVTWGYEDATLPDDDREWNKIAGTPRWLQADETPGPGWRFAFQFDAGATDQELADGAVCYGFVNDAGEGAFLWQCH